LPSIFALINVAIHDTETGEGNFILVDFTQRYCYVNLVF